MTYRRFAWREVGWGGAAAVIASLGLTGCPGGGGGGGCPEIGGSWQVQSTCEGAPTSCEIEQDGCKVELFCGGRMLAGTVSKSSISFKDDDISCSGKLDDLEDDNEDGVIYPTFEADCQLAGDMCEVQASCFQGDCTVPEDEDVNGGDGDGDGDGPAGQGGASGVFGMSGVGGASGIGGQGGVSGQGPAGSGGFSGIGGSGAVSGEGGSPAGSGGIGGSVSNDCGSCIESACSVEAAACTTANGCDQAASCVLGSGCYFDQPDCLEAACSSVQEPNDEGLTAFEEVLACTATSCQDSCLVLSGGPVAGTGGAGGEGGGSAPQPCDTCVWANDNVCDEGVDCDFGTDCTDCGGPAQ